MKAALARGLPLALLGGLAVWTALDLALRAPLQGALVGGVLLALSVAAGIQGARASLPAWHRASHGLLGLTFFGERLLWAGVDVGAMIAFLVLLMALASLEGLGRTFGAVYASMAGDSGLREKVDSAALGAYVRALGLLGFTFVASVMLALLVPLVVVRENSLVAAFGLALGLLVVIGWLALSPSVPVRRKS